MTEPPSPRDHPDLTAWVDALEAAARLADGRLDPAPVAQVDATIGRSRDRLRHGTDRTVIALAGPTGAGKSTLFNALAGASISDTGVRRPTTGVAHACVWGDGGEPLLDWLGVSRRHHLDAEARFNGLVLIDLPDFDSTVAEHRHEVDRLIELVDLMIWVTDPQKYADDALHAGYLRPLADFGEVMRFAVNKIDTVEPVEAEAIIADFQRHLVADGIESPQVTAVSAEDGRGLDELRQVLAETVTTKQATTARIAADLRAAAGVLDPGAPGEDITTRQRQELITSLGRAAGLDDTVSLSAAQHRSDASKAMGWPPAQWLRRRRRQPIADLPRVGTSRTTTAEVAGALRRIGEHAGSGLTRPWPVVVRRTAQDRLDDTVAALSTMTATGARAHLGRARWWAPVGWLQRVLAVIAAVGVAWLVVVAVLSGFLQLDADPLLVDTPGAEWIPLPSLLLLAGVGLGLLLALLARIPAAVGARRRARSVRSRLEADVAVLADREIVAPVRAVLGERAELQDLLATVRGESTS